MLLNVGGKMRKIRVECGCDLKLDIMNKSHLNILENCVCKTETEKSDYTSIAIVGEVEGKSSKMMK